MDLDLRSGTLIKHKSSVDKQLPVSYALCGRHVLGRKITDSGAMIIALAEKIRRKYKCNRTAKIAVNT